MDRREFLKRTGVVVMGIRALNGAAVEEAFTEVVWDDHTAHIALHRTNMAQLDEIMRNLYLPPIREHLNQHSLLLEAMRD